ncbi:MAG TPA: flavodoxin domain-containing protein, partial [Syntrophales bacterium]
GQHYASEYMFNDLVDQSELMAECIKYYANILTPFSELVTKKIQEVLALNLPVDVICTSHGVIWRENPVQIVQQYLKWADSYQENQISLIYDTMWNGTRIMAENIAQGVNQIDPLVNLKLFNLAKSDRNDVMTEIFRSKAIVVGSPTINRGLLTSIAGLLEEMKGLRFRNKKAAAFGCYGWSGESVKTIKEQLTAAGFDVVDDGLRCLWNPDPKGVESCIEYGRKLSDLLK